MFLNIDMDRAQVHEELDKIGMVHQELVDVRVQVHQDFGDVYIY